MCLSLLQVAGSQVCDPLLATVGRKCGQLEDSSTQLKFALNFPSVGSCHTNVEMVQIIFYKKPDAKYTEHNPLNLSSSVAEVSMRRTNPQCHENKRPVVTTLELPQAEQ